MKELEPPKKGMEPIKFQRPLTKPKVFLGVTERDLKKKHLGEEKEFIQIPPIIEKKKVKYDEFLSNLEAFQGAGEEDLEEKKEYVLSMRILSMMYKAHDEQIYEMLFKISIVQNWK